MSFDVFLTFNGECRSALEFYAQVFNQKTDQVMTFGQNPEGSAEADKDKIMYACIPIHGCNVMFSDCSSGSEFIKGNNISLTVGLKDEAEIKKIFNKLAEGGEIGMDLGKTFFSELFGVVTDKFGINWQITKTPAD
jgi:PhnB protein